MLTNGIINSLMWASTGFVSLTILVLVTNLWLQYRQVARIAVGEMEVAVIFEDDGKRFSRFLPPGHHWIRPLHEKVHGFIKTSGQTVRGRCDSAQTYGGLPISVDWGIQFSLNPVKIGPEKAPKMAKALIEKSGGMVTQHVNHILHHIADRYTIEELCQAGIHEKLERSVRNELKARLHALGFKITRVMIEGIHKPEQVLAAIEAAHQKDLQAAQEARTLARLQQVISQFSDEDMRRLVEIEKIHAMSKNGVVVMPSFSDQLHAESISRQNMIYSQMN